MSHKPKLIGILNGTTHGSGTSVSVVVIQTDLEGNGPAMEENLISD